MNKKAAKDIDDYIERYPEEVQQLLNQMRRTIQKAAPKARETISYSLPAFTLENAGLVVWFAAHKGHIGFYPKASGMAAFKKELSVYKTSKGAVQFPLDMPLPLGVVKRITQFRLKEELAKRKGK